jgi:outer membrane protein assembly factor BamB
MKLGLRLPGFCLAVLVVLAASVSFAPAKSQPVAIQDKLVASTGEWTTYHHDDARTGFDSTQPKATSATTGWASVALDGEIYAEPLIHNGVVYAATLNDTVYALDQATGVVIWSKNVGAPQTSGWSCSGLHAGILSTPVIDTAANRIYVAAELATATPTYHLFGLDLAALGNIVLNVAIAPAGFDWHIQQQRGALAVHVGFVYVPFGGRAGDCGNYSGWVVGVPTSGVGSANVFQTSPVGTSIWAAGGVVVDDSTGNVFAATGNGVNHGTGDGCSADGLGNPVFENDAVVRMSPTLVEQDHFMPVDWQNNWCGNDQDLGSAAPVLISPTLMFSSGKWGGGFLLNPNSLAGVNGQLYPPKVPYNQAEVCFGNRSDATFGGFAYAAPFVYVECEGRGLVALNVNTAAPSFSPCNAACAAPDWSAGSGTFGPPIVAGGAVWVANDGGGLFAYDQATGAQIFHSAGFGINRFVTPAEAGGSVFVPSHNVIRSFDMHSCGAPLFTSYFNWFDNVTAGMVGDNIHLLNTGGAPSTGCITLGSRALAFNVPAGAEQYMTFPPGTIGGPVVVTVDSGPAVLASQRVQYYQSFNEVWSLSASQAALTSYINWFDRASPGMVGDNIHVLNPGGTTANVTVSLAGATPISFSLGGGLEHYVTFPVGHIGGPVTITSDQPVLASQRVQYYQSFNEEVAHSAAQAVGTSYFNWFDKATPGMVGDNIHVFNPGGAIANVTVSLPGATTMSFSVGAGVETYVSFPAGHIGGPVTVTSSQPVLSTQRVQYFQSFNEVASASAAQAAPTSHIMWFDKATPGMVGDNIHVLNPGGVAANVTVSLPGATSVSLSVGAGAEAYVTFPVGHIGGPVTITSSQPVLAAQRVQYFSSFNEVPSA